MIVGKRRRQRMIKRHPFWVLTPMLPSTDLSRVAKPFSVLESHLPTDSHFATSVSVIGNNNTSPFSPSRDNSRPMLPVYLPSMHVPWHWNEFIDNQATVGTPSFRAGEWRTKLDVEI